ncbi:hypothetical protein D3C71_1559920 [compost metagenome]
MQFDRHFFLAGDLHQLFDLRDNAANFFMAEHDCFEHDFFRHFICFRFHHHDGVFGSRHNEIDVALFLLGNRRIDDKFTADASYDNTADRTAERYIRNAQRSRGSDHGRDFRRAVLVHAHYKVQHLDVIAEAFREQRANRPVGQSAGQNRLLARSSFALDEAAGNFAYCVQALFIVDGQREEVQILRLAGCCNRTEYRSIAVTDHNRSVRLLGKPPRFQNESSAPELHFYLFLHKVPPWMFKIALS